MRPSMRHLLLAGACAISAVHAGSASAQATAAHPGWSRRAVIYEINVRQYTPEGTFAALQRRLPGLDSLGVDIVWLMPVQPIGKKSRKGGLGSYYSISDYTDINAEYGTRADAKAFIAAAHRHGIKVLLDWVPNHTAFDHKWITAHPDWYSHRKDGSISYAHDNEDKETDWTDVAELNYGSTAMRRAMIADMTWWLKEMKIDGFRCDVAGGVPLDFWVEARRDLSRVRPDLFMLAEAEGPQYHRSFDMTYGWELHHMLNEISKGKMPTSSIDAYLARQDSTYPPDAYRMYFTSNHDENSWNGTEFERMGANHLPSFVLAATLKNSMPLLYTGQEASFNRRLRFFDKDTVTWTGPSLVPFYHAMFDLRHREHALWNGAAGGAESRLSTDGGEKVYAFTRTRGSNTVLVAVNFGDTAASASYTGLTAPGRYRDWFSHDMAALASTGRLDIPAHGYRVLVK